MTMLKLEDKIVALERLIASASTTEKKRVARRLYSLINATELKPAFSASNCDDDLLFDNVPV